MGSYHAPKSRAFFAAADMLSNVTNVNFGGHVMLCYVMLFFGQPTRPCDRAHRRLGCTLYFRDGSKRELPSGGLMSASSGSGHAVA